MTADDMLNLGKLRVQLRRLEQKAMELQPDEFTREEICTMIAALADGQVKLCGHLERIYERTEEGQ